jgi:hypothetical protein
MVNTQQYTTVLNGNGHAIFVQAPGRVAPSTFSGAAGHRMDVTPYNASGIVPFGARHLRAPHYKAARVAQPTLQNGVITGRQFDDLLARDERILVIESKDPAGTAHQFREFAGQTGKAMYLWRPDEGLTSLKVVDMRVPGSTRLTEALRYIANSKHYGIYGFVDFEGHLKVDSIQLLRDIAKSRAGYERRVVLITTGVTLPQNLEDQCARIQHEPRRQLRLRDGRWVV